ncbi:hypothetical protein EOI67_22555 [Salmonella enterica]|nr:hypothetical protein [Salmonella enterica]
MLIVCIKKFNEQEENNVIVSFVIISLSWRFVGFFNLMVIKFTQLKLACLFFSLIIFCVNVFLTFSKTMNYIYTSFLVVVIRISLKSKNKNIKIIFLLMLLFSKLSKREVFVIWFYILFLVDFLDGYSDGFILNGLNVCNLMFF